MFSATFYPTPGPVIDQMLEGLNLQGKKVLEPSAGAGHIVKAAQAMGAEVIACEKDEDLRKIVQTYCKLICDDFLTLKSEQVSHIDYIIMNPPFNQGAEHILHAWNIAPAGCKIIALCNAQTMENRYSKSREELGTVLDNYGQAQDLGDCFSQADRRTDVNVLLIRLNKPGEASNEFEGFFLEEEVEDQYNGLMPYNVVRDLVNRYVGAVKIFDKQLQTAEELNDLCEGYFGAREIGMTVTRENKPLRRNEFKKDMQRAGWAFIFNKMNLKKYSTKGLKEDINKFIETQEQIPFTMKNIYKMLEIVIGTAGQRMDKAILEVFERVTKHTHENRYNVEGWQTNSHYLLNKRFIVPSMVGIGWSGQIDRPSWSNSNFEMIEDLMKALCYVSGENYSDKVSLEDFISYPFLLKKDGKYLNSMAYDFDVKYKEKERERIIQDQENHPGSEIEENHPEWGKWFEWGYFRCRAYKKGTMHFEFKDDKLWGEFNQRVAKLMGYPLPEKVKQTKWQEQRKAKAGPRPSTTRGYKVLATIQL
jgi:hypothetical protein